MLFEIELEELRNQLDHIDGQMCSLLEKRFEITDEIGRLKKTYDQPVNQTSRETQIKQNLTYKLEGYKHLNEILNLYELLFEMSKKSQKNV